MSTKSALDYWSNQVEAIKSQGVTASAYARQHKLSLASLCYWQRKLQSQSAPHSVAVAAREAQSEFVALRVRDAVSEVLPPSWCCTLVLAGASPEDRNAARR